MNKKYIIAVVALFGLTIGGFIYYIINQNKTIEDLTETFALEKEDLENEYSQLAIQYEGYKLTVNNDSLEQKLEDQRIRFSASLKSLSRQRHRTPSESLLSKKNLKQCVVSYATMLPRSIL